MFRRGAAGSVERRRCSKLRSRGWDLGRSDGFTTLAINAAWRPMRGVLLSAGIDNLFDRLYAEHMSRGGAMLAGYTQTTRVNEPGRTLWLRVGGDFK